MLKEKNTIKQLKEMLLHESKQLSDCHWTSVTRVPNGLLYRYVNYDRNFALSQFVPLNSNVDNIDNDDFGEKE